MNDAPVAPSEPLLRTLAPALRELEKRVRGWQIVKHRQTLTALQKATLEGLAGDLGRQADALQLEKPLLIIMLMGGTGVGKSTLLNALAGGAIAHASFQRPTTRDPVVYYHESIQAQRLDPALQLCKLAVHDRPALEQKILVDTPDLDSNDVSNREKLLKLLPVADIVLYVGSQEKYHDRLGWELFLEHRKRRAFAFILNKWDRCQHPGASGRKPDDDLLDDLRGQGFENPLIFRTCAQHWVDHPLHPETSEVSPPVAGEQFRDLVRWLEAGLNRLEIEAIKARGVSQLLEQLQQAMESQRPPDISRAVQRVVPVWDQLFVQEAEAATATLLNTLEPYQKEIEQHFAIERQRQFSGVMGFYLRWFNRLRYAGSGLRDKLPFVARLATPVNTPKQFDLGAFTQAWSKAAFEQNLDARQRALGNRLLVDANTLGIPLQLLSDQAEAVSRQDWTAKHAEAMMDILGHVERSWTEPAGVRRVFQKTLIFLADWLPVVAVGGMGTLMLWQYIGPTGDRRSFQFSDLFMPLIVVVMVMIVLHVLIVIFLPLNWKTIRGDFEHQLRERLHDEMKKSYGPLPGQLAEDLLAERRQLDQFLAEIREIASWLSQREQAASIMSLYGK
jgi:hypothetical protein